MERYRRHAREHAHERIAVGRHELLFALAAEERHVHVADLPCRAGERKGCRRVHVDHQTARREQAHGHHHGARGRGRRGLGAQHIAVGQAALKHPVAQTNAHVTAGDAPLAMDATPYLVPLEVDEVNVELAAQTPLQRDDHGRIVDVALDFGAQHGLPFQIRSYEHTAPAGARATPLLAERTHQAQISALKRVILGLLGTLDGFGLNGSRLYGSGLDGSEGDSRCGALGQGLRTGCTAA